FPAPRAFDARLGRADLNVSAGQRAGTRETVAGRDRETVATDGGLAEVVDVDREGRRHAVVRRGAAECGVGSDDRERGDRETADAVVAPLGDVAVSAYAHGACLRGEGEADRVREDRAASGRATGGVLIRGRGCGGGGTRARERADDAPRVHRASD